MTQLGADRTQGLDTKEGSQLARVGAAMLMLTFFVSMMLVFCGFWALGTWIGVD
jgi:hypothetical protein